MGTSIKAFLGVLLAAFVMLPAATDVAASPTGYDIAPEFQRFYEQYGGVRTFGYAISPAVTENGRLVQYTERQRLEYHPEHRGTEYEVLLGLLGRETARAEGRDFSAGEVIPNARHFSETGHSLDPRFQGYWEANGGIRIFGYPITSPTWENGVLVQYTERARFEYHPENEGNGYEVLLGRLGTTVWSQSENTAQLATASNDPADMLANMLNNERANAGVGNLQRVSYLNDVAIDRSTDMASRSYFSHTTPDGQNVFDIMRARGLSWSRAGETLHRNNAAQQNTREAAERALRGFMNSAEHKRILTDGRYQQVGIGYQYGSDGFHYFTVVVMTQ